MYCEIKSYESTNEAINLEVVDLDQCLLNGWDQDFTESTVTMSFPLENRGARVYLYKLCRSNKKTSACKTMEEMVQIALAPGTILNISSNFITK